MTSVRLTLALLAAAAATGCRVATPPFSETHAPAPRDHEQVARSIVIAPVAEARSEGPEGDPGGGLWAFLPLIPYGTQVMTPEVMLRGVPYDLRADLTDTIAKERRASSESSLASRPRKDPSSSRG